MSHESYWTNLSSRLWVTHECMIQYHNSILDTREWCTHEVHHLWGMYHMLRVNCMHVHLWIFLPLMLCDVHSIQTFPGCELYASKPFNHHVNSSIVQFCYYHPKIKETHLSTCYSLFNKWCTPMSLKYQTTLEDHCILCTLQSISERMLQRWPLVQFTCNVQYVARK